ncbi:XRE family transcriptional regulator [Paenibacillaceae bacterium]|nr:XRE family transcriptional regulator [Paenibacillaceae bacterium]
MLGERLRSLRKERKMTQEQLASFLNAVKSTISQYENNINEPDIETIKKLADCFDVSVDYLLGRDLYSARGKASVSNGLLKERLTEDEEGYLKESLATYRKWKAKRKET